MGNGDGTLRQAVNFPTESNANVATAYDWNGDGKADLAVGHFLGAVQILVANADGSMRTGARYSMPSAEGAIASLAAADLNGDHIADLMILTDTKLHLMYGSGDGTFNAGPIFGSGGPSGSVGAGDFNLDGITDFAVANGTLGVAYIYQGTGGGAFNAPVGYATINSAFGAKVSGFFVSDFDGDGNPDLVFAAGHPDALMTAYLGTNIAVLFGNGDGTFASGAVVPVDGQCRGYDEERNQCHSGRFQRRRKAGPGDLQHQRTERIGGDGAGAVACSPRR